MNHLSLKDCTGRSLAEIQALLTREELIAPAGLVRCNKELYEALKYEFNYCWWCGVWRHHPSVINIALHHVIGGAGRSAERCAVVAVCERLGESRGCHWRIENHPAWALWLKMTTDPEHFDYERLCRLAHKILDVPLEPPGYFRSLSSTGGKHG